MATFTQEILNGKLHFLCSGREYNLNSHQFHPFRFDKDKKLQSSPSLKYNYKITAMKSKMVKVSLGLVFSTSLKIS